MPERRAAERARRLRAGRRGGWLFAAMAVAGLLASAGRAGTAEPGAGDCFSDDNERRISGCSRLIETPGATDNELALAYAMRALAYSLKGRYELALPDYDAAIKAQPDFAIALNNRAWALYKSGRAEAGLADVERALELSPHSPHALDTRAHIRQAGGESELALADYELAMRFGGEHMVKLYQCGLQAAGLYSGEVDGLYTRALRQALEACVASSACDPLPADEECRKATS
jgi:tetratricopeptide (TPR) repeat protein